MAKAVSGLLAVLALAGMLAADALKLKRSKSGENPPAYAAFSRVLSQEDQYRHALDRLTFGPRPGDLDGIEQTGLKRWLDEALHPEKILEDPTLEERLASFKVISMTPAEMAGEFSGQMPQAKQGRRLVANELAEAKIVRAVYSNHQFAELLDDFWFNHFNVFVNKGADRFYVAAYERDAIRPHLFGKFYDLLLATAKSPAMLFYLDNWQSAGPDAPVRPLAKKRAKRGFNENYGRELLELHTLGVNGGYTQKDVIEVARCFTGWTIARPGKGGGFEYNDRLHDKGRKVVLGHVIRAGRGMNDGIEVLKILAQYPATAHHISLELAQRFVADDPPPSLVNRMSKTFLKTNGDLRAVLETMLSSPEFWSEGAFHAKVKSALEMLVSAVRAADADVQSARALNAELQKLGEPLYRKVEPTGYSNANSEWVSSAGLLDRMKFGLALAQNRIPGVRVDSTRWQNQPDKVQMARSIVGAPLSEQTESAIEHQASASGTPDLVAGLTFGSPEFQRH